ncbi:MAG TPA: LPS assembly lipoprotein LptE [Dokdonella sp.]|nr:LPS assembly lipoprotein LptE [Dokdonella sp.]
MNVLRLPLVVLLAVLVSGCGFHLRGEAQLSPAMQVLSIEGADALSPLGRDLRKALVRSGARVVEVGAEGAAVLRIGSNQLRTDVLSVGGNARANEYTIRYHVEFDVVDARGTALVARQTIELTRDFTFDATQALGIAAEQDLLTGELQRDMVQAILRRLEAAGRESRS